MSGRPRYPWNEGDALFASELNAAIANAGGGPYLPIVIGDGTGAPYLALNGAAGTAKAIHWQSNAVNRWLLQTNASDDLALYAYDAGGGFIDTAMIFNSSAKIAGFGFQLQSYTSNATAMTGVAGANFDATNTGSNTAQGHKFVYHSSAATNGFDVGATTLALFDPVFIGGQVPAYFGQWVVAQSPNDTTHPWQTCCVEFDVVNRGADRGFQRDRSVGTTTGGLLVVPEITVFGGGAGEGKNATYGYTTAKAGSNNSTGFPAKFYTNYLVEPNSTVGLTGRAIYTTGDISGTGSQYPYGPMQTDGTWLHGIDHTLATYTDNHAEVMKTGQGLAWITGTTGTPGGTATIIGSGSGADASITLASAGAGKVAVMGKLNLSSIPTSAAGLIAGDVWRNGTVLNIV